jgi:hypothetical protein
VDFALTRRRSQNFKLPESKTLEASPPSAKGPQSKRAEYSNPNRRALLDEWAQVRSLRQPLPCGCCTKCLSD